MNSLAKIRDPTSVPARVTVTPQEAPMDINEDPLRASLRAIWATAAPSWGEHARHLDTRSAEVTQAMLDAAGIQPGADVIELACGPGGVGIAAAEIVGPD